MTVASHIPKSRDHRSKSAVLPVPSVSHQDTDSTPENLNLVPQNLTPETILQLQRTIGNQAVQRLINTRQPKPTVQRDATEDVMTPVENLSGHTSNIGDFIGNDKAGFGQSTAGSTVGTIGSVGGMGIGAVKMGVKGRELHKVRGELSDVREREEAGEDHLHTTIALLERKRDAAAKGVAEGTGTVLGGISGFIGSVAGFFTSGTAQVLSKVAGAVGAGLAILIGTIAAIRDFMNVHKRAKAKDAIGLVLDSYTELAGGLSTELAPKQQTINTILNTPRRSRTVQQRAALINLSQEVASIEGRFDSLDKMRLSLAVSHRKQGSGGKILSGVMNLVGVAGSASLLALGIGALGVAGVGAAAGPVGWALVGLAAVVALSYFVGQKIKQAIRASNVTRMNEEITLVDEFISTGKVSGADVVLDSGVNASTLNKTQRLGVTWKRSMFPTIEKKGWFNKLISKSKSGKMTIGERKQELNEYLAKYDKEAAANTVWDGFKRALAPGAEGDMEVDNPQHGSKNPTAAPEKITLRQQIENLIAFNFGASKVGEFKGSIAAGGAKEKSARSLLMQKMKLEDK